MGLRPSIQLAVIAAATLLTTTPSLAELRVCNKSNERASVAVGYNHSERGWTSEGWWRVPIGDCMTIINGDLSSRYYYIYATGHRGGTWSGPKSQDGGFFCITQEKFTFYNRDYQRDDTINCERKSLQTKKFSIVDTQDNSDFTYNLTE